MRSRLGGSPEFVVNVHWSVLVILWFVHLESCICRAVGGYPAVVYWLLGASGAVMLLASLFFHELAPPSSLVAPGYPLRA